MKKIVSSAIAVCLLLGSYAQKPGWQHLDYQTDSVLGMSTRKAYQELLKGKKASKVIVGIIDTGIDTAQEDLKSVIWKDPNTGYSGWNFIAAETGQEDITRLTGYNKRLYDSLAYTTVPEQYRAGYQQHRKLEPGLEAKIRDIQSLIAELGKVRKVVDVVVKKLGKDDPTLQNFKDYLLQGEATVEEKEILTRVNKRFKLYPNWITYRYNEIDHILDMAKYHLAHGLNLENEERDTALGNGDITPDKLGPLKELNIGSSYHGTHVAGIIGAVRDNGIGMDGIADNVQMLILKDNGTLREVRDEAVARAIRYAVDHGAKVINMSFGKPYTWNKKLVDDAVKYAMKNDVLLVHAAGNAGQNLDNEEHYPNPVYADSSGKAEAWLEVGASGPKDDSTLAADFSNFGKRDVDVFAPGVAIYSTLPFNQYNSWEGTSMAAPMVTGLVALIREYYPRLTAAQVKQIIIRSVLKRSVLTDKCVSGGIVNAYNALKLAASY